MNNKHRAKLIFLCLLASSILAACGNTASKDPAASDSLADNLQATETTAEAVLPVMDLGGYTFRIAHWYNDAWASRSCVDIVAEAENGDAINDAVYRRNLAVTDTYNVNFSLQTFDMMEMPDIMRTSIIAGDDAFDLMYLRLWNQKSMFVEGLFLDFNTIPYINLENPWWDSGCVKSMTVLDRLYLAASSINISDENATACVLFNKEIAQKNDLEDPYQMVKDGEWTIDAMREMYTGVTADLDGDGKMSGKDIWGFLGANDVASSFYVGAGGTYVSRDADGNLYDSFDNERNFDIVAKIQSVMTDNDNFYNHHTGTQRLRVTDDNQYRDLFSNGHGLFFWSRMDEVTTLRSMETDFGILPTPKYDAAQENYISLVSQHTTGLMSVPNTVSDPERTGIVLEALAKASYTELTPAYYETTLKYKASRDEDSADMLDIIFANRVYDLGEYCNFGGVADIVSSVCRDNSLGTASEYESRKKSIESSLQEMMDAIAEIE